MKRDFKFHFYYPTPGGWKYFEDFYFIPTIATFSLNTFTGNKGYMFTRYISFMWLWFHIDVSWKYGKADKIL